MVVADVLPIWPAAPDATLVPTTREPDAWLADVVDETAFVTLPLVPDACVADALADMLLPPDALVADELLTALAAPVLLLEPLAVKSDALDAEITDDTLLYPVDDTPKVFVTDTDDDMDLCPTTVVADA